MGGVLEPQVLMFHLTSTRDSRLGGQLTVGDSRSISRAKDVDNQSSS
jgi:hypothetical protein